MSSVKTIELQKPSREWLQDLAELNLTTWSQDTGFDFFDSNGSKVFKLSLPLNYTLPTEESTLKEYISSYQVNDGIAVVVIIQAGECVLGIVEQGNVLTHKLIRKYMVRKKQGGAQISHLNTKGKSKAGSRIRLKQGIVFFEEINTHLTEWLNDFDVGLIVYGISPSLKSIWVSSKVPRPFNSDDPRLRKINWPVNTPRRSELNRAVYQLNLGRISIFDPLYAEIIESINKKRNLHG